MVPWDSFPCAAYAPKLTLGTADTVWAAPSWTIPPSWSVPEVVLDNGAGARFALGGLAARGYHVAFVAAVVTAVTLVATLFVPALFDPALLDATILEPELYIPAFFSLPPFIPALALALPFLPGYYDNRDL